MSPTGTFRGGMGMKSRRTEALDLHRELNYSPERIAAMLGIEEDRVKEWIYGKARKANARRKSISPASPEQRAKVKDRTSIIEGEGPIDPMHLWPRSLGGCDDADCVVPAHRSVHRAHEREHSIDILPALIAHGYYVEIAHAVIHAKGDLVAVLERLTCDKWYPRTTGLPE